MEFIGNSFAQCPVDVVLPLVVFVGAFAVSGYYSFGFLFGLPDFEHRERMLWGAKWFWAVMAAIPTAAYLVTYEGIRCTPYPVTSMQAGMIIFQLGLAVVFPLLQHQAAGSAAAVDLIGLWLRRKPFDFDEWLASQQRRRQQQRSLTLLTAVGLLMTASFTFLGLSGSYRVEREIAELYGGKPLVLVLKHELDSPVVEGVFIEGGLTREPYELVVRVRRDTTAKQGDDVARRTERALASLGEPRQWLIHVVRRGEKARQREALSESMYVPRVRPKASPSSREPERQDASRGPAGIGSRAPQGREFATERGMMDSPRRTREEVGAHAS